MDEEKVTLREGVIHDFQHYDSNREILKTYDGSLQSDWTDAGTLDPISEWATEIIEEGVYYSPFASLVQKGGQRRRANKKQLFWKALRQTSNVSTSWATGVSSVYSYEHQLDFDSCYIDPIEYRTNTPVAYETMEEVDNIPLETHIRSTLTYYTSRFTTYWLYTVLDDGKLDGSYDWCVAGSALAYCDDNTVDWETALSVDNLKSGIEAIIADLYTPTDMLLPPALWADLWNESQFVNASQYGGNEQIRSGKIPRFLGVDYHLDTDIPDDSADADVAVMFDRTKFMGMVIANEGAVKVYDRYETGEYDFTVRMKLGTLVLQEKAGCAFYT